MTQDRTPKVASRRGPTKAAIAESIVKGYRPSDGCPPLKTFWGGDDLTMTPWLKAFAKAIADNPSWTDSWNKLAGECDRSRIIDLLHLLTYPKKLKGAANQEPYRRLTEEIKKILAKYDKLGCDIGALLSDARLADATAYVRSDLIAQLQVLETATKRLQTVRDQQIKWGSRKRNPRHWFLFLLASETFNKTGSYHFHDLATLIDAAFAARGETRDTDFGTIKRQMERWIEFMNAKIIDGRVTFTLDGRDFRTVSPAPASPNEDVPF